MMDLGIDIHTGEQHIHVEVGCKESGFGYA